MSNQPSNSPRSHTTTNPHSAISTPATTPKPYLVDSHCHLHDQEWFTPEQAEDFLAEASCRGVRQVIIIGTDPVDSQNAQTFAAAHPGVYWTYGIHPEYATQISDSTSGLDSELEIRHLYEKSLRTSSFSAGIDPVAIGEIGLDYHYDGYDRAAQLRLFEQMLQLARNLALPISLHIRGHSAFTDAWSVLDNFPELTGIVHSFTGSKQELKRALARDFYVGVNGLATYSTLALPPLEKMILETDAPFLTPVPFRGKINQPGYVRDIAAYLAAELGVAEETIAEQTTKNARGLFHLRDTVLPEAK